MNCYCGHPKERHNHGEDEMGDEVRYGGNCKHCLCSEYGPKPKALEEKPCCVAELGCLCPDKDGMSEHDSEKCPCPEHYSKHEEWLRNLIAIAKPQEALEEKLAECDCNGMHEGNCPDPRVAKPQDEPKECCDMQDEERDCCNARNNLRREIREALNKK